MEISDKKKCIINTFFIVLLIFPFFQPEYLNLSDTFSEKFYNIAKIISACFMWIFYIYYCIKNKHISLIYLVYFALQFYILMNTWIQFGLYRNVIVNFITSVTFLMIIDCFLQRNPKELIHSMLIILEILIFINFIYLLIHPEGLYGPDKHFLGNRCLFILYTTIALTLSLLWKNYTGKSLRFYSLLLICIVSTLIEGSATGKIGLLLYLILFFTSLYAQKGVCLTTGFIGYIVLFFAGVVFRFQNIFAPFFVFLGKNVTFSGRTLIWDDCFNFISKQPFFGYGFVDNDQMVSMINYIHCHNTLLEHLFLGGIVEVLILIVFFVFMTKKMQNVKNNLQTKVIILGVFLILLHMLVEAGQKPICYILFFIIAYAENICNAMPSYIINDKTLYKNNK